MEIDRAARERMDAMLPHMMEAADVTEELKARDPMRWVGLMNALKAQAEEIVLTERIYQGFCPVKSTITTSKAASMAL